MIGLLLLLHLSPLEAATTTLTVNPSSRSGSYSVSSGGYGYFKFAASAGYEYRVCINTTGGDADIYGSTSSTVSKASSNASENSGTEDDCIVYTASSARTYYLAAYGYKASTYYIYVIGYPLENAPAAMTGLLSCPFNDGWMCSMYCGSYTDGEYGPFGSPWGNPIDAPFYSTKTSAKNYPNYFHNGVDYAAPIGTNVYAVYDGVVKKVGSLGSGYGYYVLVEHTVGGSKFCSTYDHLENDATYSAWSVGETIAQYDQVGNTVDITIAGETDHLHYGLYGDACPTGTPTLQAGAMSFEYWKSYSTKFINPDGNDNPGIYADW